MERLVALSFGDFREDRNLFALFAGIALILAVIGIYGVMSYFVNARTHEIGVRVALGALPRDVFELIGGLGLKLSAIGVASGAALASRAHPIHQHQPLRRKTNRPADLRLRRRHPDRHRATGLLHPRPPRRKSRPHGRPSPRIEKSWTARPIRSREKGGQYENKKPAP